MSVSAYHLGSEAGTLDIRGAFGALRRRKWSIAGPVLLGIGLAALLAAVITPRYTASSTVMVEPLGARLFDEADIVMPSYDDDETFIENQVKLLGSRSNVQQVILDLGLHNDPGFDPDPPLVSLDRIAHLQHRVLALFGLPAGAAADGSNGGASIASGSDQQASSLTSGEPDETFVREFSERLRVVRDKLSGAISVSFSAADPVRAAQIANAVVDAYVERKVEERISTIGRASRYLTAQTGRLREQALQAERAVEDYRAANQQWDNQGTNLSAQQLAALRIDLNAAQVDRVIKEARLRHVYDLQAEGNGYKPLAEVASSPVIVNLLQRDDELMREEASLAETLGPAHPDMLGIRSERERLAQRIDQEIRNIIRSLEGEVTVAQARERAIESFLEEARLESGVTGRAGIELGELEREADTTRSAYEAALERLAGLQEQAELYEADAKVISPAVTLDEPDFPKLGVMIAAGLVTSLTLGIGLAALREHLDSGLRTGRQLEEALDLPALGLVPRIRRMRGHRTPHQYLLDRPSSTYAEAVKSVFMHAHLSQDGVPPRVVLVTSTLPGEGKTTLAMSLGASIARSGHKTVVVDLDLRQPSVARELGWPVETGLLAFMAGQRTLDEVILHDPREPNLHILPAEDRTASPTDLLASPIMGALLAELRVRYEYIVLDSPPALGFSDVNIAAQLADAVLFVVQWEKTSGTLAANGLEALRRGHAPVIGAAVTQVDLRKHARYGYSDIGNYYSKYNDHFTD